METKSIQQEILLVTGTSFSSRQWVKTDDLGTTNLTDQEKLQEACWNGLLQEMLPEICKHSKSFLWRVIACESFLELNLGELPVETDRYFSINPYLFLSAAEKN